MPDLTDIRRLDEAFLIPSSTKEGVSYVVYYAATWHCQCPDFTYREHDCKHIRLVNEYMKGEWDMLNPQYKEKKEELERWAKLAWG